MTCKDSGKIKLDTVLVKRFWDRHMRMEWARMHPGKGYTPIGLFTDDARYNFMGSKLTAMVLNLPCQNIESTLLAQLNRYY